MPMDIGSDILLNAVKLPDMQDQISVILRGSLREASSEARRE